MICLYSTLTFQKKYWHEVINTVYIKHVIFFVISLIHSVSLLEKTNPWLTNIWLAILSLNLTTYHYISPLNLNFWRKKYVSSCCGGETLGYYSFTGPLLKTKYKLKKIHFSLKIVCGYEVKGNTKFDKNKKFFKFKV